MTRLMTSTQHVFSGVCICGHEYFIHHGQMVMNREAAELMKSHATWYCECLALGCNEMYEPCPTCPKGFIDKDDPLREEKLKE